MSDDPHLESRGDRVLVIESDVVVRHEICEYLRQCGFVAIEAGTTDEAVIVLSDRAIEILSVLCAAECQGSLNRFEFAQWVRRERPAVVVRFAGNVEKAAHLAAELCDGGPGVRPYDPSVMVSSLRRRLARFDG